MKKFLLAFILIIVLFIPTIIAISNYKSVQNAPVGAKTTISVKIEDLNGNIFLYEKKTDGDAAEDVINFFLDINSRATKLQALPDSVVGTKSFIVTMATAVKEESYQYYLSLDPSLCYYRTPDGAPFQLTGEDAASFLKKDYTESLYEYSGLPTLKFSEEYTVAPNKAKWSYRNFSGEFTEALAARYISEEKQYYEGAGGIGLSFDIVPDHMNLKVADEAGNLIFDDEYQNLSSLKIENEMKVRLEISAKWYEDSTRNYYGESTYSFEATVSSPPAFYASQTEGEQGVFITITALGVSSPDKIKLTSEPALEYEPRFYMDGEYVRTLLPFDISTPAGTYKLTLSYGGTSQTIDFNLSEKKLGDSYMTVSDTVLSSAYSEAALKAFDDLKAELLSTASDTRYWDGYFAEGVSADSGLICGFGRKVIINNNMSNTFLSNGVSYGVTAGGEITAANAGIVVYAGSLDYTGNIVVIEHGYGLKTWYYNLGTADVKNGDTVKRGDKIGTAGETGFTDRTGAHISMSVNNVFVCPYDTWQDGKGGIAMF